MMSSARKFVCFVFVPIEISQESISVSRDSFHYSTVSVTSQTNGLAQRNDGMEKSGN
jgi:hypothetical protein